MVATEPLRLRLVADEFADRVPSPAHDSLTPEGRRAALERNPDSYLAVTRSIEDLDPATDATIDQLLQMGRASLDRLIDLGAFESAGEPAYYAYQLETDTHCQTGLVGGVATADFVQGGVRVHEQIHHERSAHLARHLAIVGVQSSPIAVAHTPLPDLAAILERTVAHQTPDLEVESEPGFIQRIWTIDPASSPLVTDSLRDQPLYLIDGHHRAAASIEHRRLQGPGSADMTLCALFPTDELANYAFHRVLPSTIGSLDTVGALTGHGARSIAHPSEVVAGTDAQSDGELAMYDGSTGRWWALAAPAVGGVAPSLAHLAPTRLANRFDAAFGTFANDGAAGQRWRDLVRYRPGVLPLEQLTTEADDRHDVLFVLPALSIESLMAVADAGLAMPPKSTYFDPKVRSGIFLRHM